MRKAIFSSSESEEVEVTATLVVLINCLVEYLLVYVCNTCKAMS